MGLMAATAWCKHFFKGPLRSAMAETQPEAVAAAEPAAAEAAEPAAAEAAQADPEKGEDGEENEDEDEDEEDYSDEEEYFDDSLPCNMTYVVVCILMPILNGGLNGFMWPGYSLHFVDQEWPLWIAGIAVMIGYLLRATTQQMQLQAGYWLIVPLAVIHLVFAVLGLIFRFSLWAVFAQIVVFLGIDPTCAIEGICFDTFGGSEVQARQATSTMLSVFTIAVASSCTLGGVCYDLFGWAGVGVYHSSCQGLQLFLICTQPAVRKSFRMVWFPSPEDDSEEEEEEEDEENPKGKDEAFTNVMPVAIQVVAPEVKPSEQILGGGFIIYTFQVSTTFIIFLENLDL